MKITTGVDIIEVDRIKKAIEELEDSFLNRIYTKKEIKYCETSDVMKFQHYAARFAGKEAVFKALSEYISGREDLLWNNIEILNDECGKPYVNVEKIKENFKSTANNLYLDNIEISLSHIKEYAIANVVAVFNG